MMRKTKLAVWMLLPLLAACSGEPSESALRQAYEKNLAKTNQLSIQLGAKHMQIELKDFKKVSCAKLEPGNYRCHIEVDLQLPMLGLQHQQGDVVASKSNGHWSITPD